MGIDYDCCLVLFLILSLICILVQRYLEIREHWFPYHELPFGNIEMSPDAGVFFLKKRYRSPYVYPYKFESSYPLPHMRHFEQKY